MIKQIYRSSVTAFSKKQTSILSAASVIMATVLVSRVLGLIRDRLLASYFSVDELGVYFAAFRIPNLLFELLIMGALSTAFIPVFTGYLVKNEEKNAFTMAAQLINLVLIVLGILIIPLLIFTRPLSFLLVPGFSQVERETMIQFTRIMIIGQLVPLVIGNFVTGMLQSFQRFLVAALAPIVYNLGIITGIYFFSRSIGLYGAVWGVVIGAVLYLLIQVPLLIKLGYRHSLRINQRDKGVREVIKLMLPRTLGLAVSQIDTTLDLVLASLLGSRSITIFHFAQHLQQLPIGLFGATFAQAALPTLSVKAAKAQFPEFKKFLLVAMHQILFFVLPASMMLIVLRTPVVRLVFGAERFDWAATVTTGKTLSLFALSIFAQSLVQLFARGFYALHDTKTPVVISILCVLVNTVLSVLFVMVYRLDVMALAMSSSIASILNALLLLIYLNHKVGGFYYKDLFLPPLKMGFASFATGVFLYVPMKLFDKLVFDTTHVFELILLTGIASFSGLSVYIFLAWFLDIDEVATFFKLVNKVKQAPRLIFAPTDELVQEEQANLP